MDHNNTVRPFDIYRDCPDDNTVRPFDIYHDLPDGREIAIGSLNPDTSRFEPNLGPARPVGFRRLRDRPPVRDLRRSDPDQA
jgi:hypothetical protein